jgi:hypothetical protein
MIASSQMTRPLTHTQKTRRLVYTGGLLLAGLLVIIGALMWHDARQQDAGPAAQAAPQSVRIQRPGFTDILLQRVVDDTWSITEPCQLPASGQRLEPLFGALTPAVHSYAAAEVDLDAAGLLRPEAVVYLDGEKVAFGHTDLSGERRYVLRNGRVGFAPEWILALVNGGLSALASLDVFPGPIETLVIEGHTAASQEPKSSDSAETTAVATVKPGPLSKDRIDQWQYLSAQQIATWPLMDGEPSTGTLTLAVQMAGRQTTLMIHEYPRFAAIRYEDASCAYILPASSIPEVDRR